MSETVAGEQAISDETLRRTLAQMRDVRAFKPAWKRLEWSSKLIFIRGAEQILKHEQGSLYKLDECGRQSVKHKAFWIYIAYRKEHDTHE